MPKRVQSPSSINLYKQCPRKYYYQYILKLPTFPNIYTLRGNIVHSVLEKFFEIDPLTLDSSNHRQELAGYISNVFDAYWKKNSSELLEYSGSESRKTEFYEESRTMIANWLNDFFNRLAKKLINNDFVSAFREITPTELEGSYSSEEYMVRGFIDVIDTQDGIVNVVDYKTSKPKETISKDYRLQLAIYALLYKEKHGKLPDKASIWFLRTHQVSIDVTEELVKEAEFEIEQIHFSTETSEICDYPCKTSPLCKWRNGQCNFYDRCIKERDL